MFFGYIFVCFGFRILWSVLGGCGGTGRIGDFSVVEVSGFCFFRVGRCDGRVGREVVEEAGVGVFGRTCWGLAGLFRS